MSFLLKQAVSSLETSLGSVNAQVNTLVDGAPIALQTLNQLASALNDDASFASIVATTLSSKANKLDVNAALDLKDNTTETQPPTDKRSFVHRRQRDLRKWHRLGIQSIAHRSGPVF